MKILVFADLHLWTGDVHSTMEGHPTGNAFRAHDAVEKHSPDVVVFCGDTVQSEHLPFLSRIQRNIVGGDIPIVSCLGNHEFWGRTWESTLEMVSGKTHGVHLLDTRGAVVIDGVNFTGGMLFFDGSLKSWPDQRVTPWGGWNDKYITNIDIDYLELNRYYTDYIRGTIRKDIPNVLVTHHVPHESLNWYSQEPGNYNYYSGMKDFLSELETSSDVENRCFCGHTHRPMESTVGNWKCSNIGSDYGDVRYQLLEL